MQCEICWSRIGKNHVIINDKQTCEQCVKDALKWFEKKHKFYTIKEELHDAIGKRNLELHYIKKKLNLVNKFGSYHESFFDYFLEFHAIVCDDMGCVCRASTFMDMICEKKLRNSKEYGRTIEEILARDKMYSVAIMVITLALVFAPLSVSASSWNGNPLASLDKQTDVNVSYHPDWNKNGNAIKAYGWQFTKICGLDLCVGEVNDGSKSKSFLQNDHSSSVSIPDQLGLSAIGDQGERLDRLSKSISVFSGKFFIKGFFQ